MIELYGHHARRLATRVPTLNRRGDLSAEQILAAVLDVWSETPGREDQWYLLQVELTLYAIRNKQVGRIWAVQQSKVRADLAGLVERVAAQHRIRLSVTSQEFVRLAQAIYQGGCRSGCWNRRVLRAAASSGVSCLWCWRPSR